MLEKDEVDLHNFIDSQQQIGGFAVLNRNWRLGEIFAYTIEDV